MTPLATHAPTIRRLFALEHAFRPRPPMPIDLPLKARPRPGEITLITGPSGGGKSSLLAAMREAPRAQSILWIEPATIRLPDACVIDCLCRALGHDAAAADERVVERALELLGRVGLAEAWTYLQRPAELSDGQRWRLMLAMAVAAAGRADAPAATAVIAMDEFAALLDRITARVVARALRRLVRPVQNLDDSATPQLSAIVATGHDDLVDALAPDTIITCDFDDYVISK